MHSCQLNALRDERKLKWIISSFEYILEEISIKSVEKNAGTWMYANNTGLQDETAE